MEIYTEQNKLNLFTNKLQEEKQETEEEFVDKQKLKRQRDKTKLEGPGMYTQVIKQRRKR